jgi:alkylated DNA repair protein alkB family protein 1
MSASATILLDPSSPEYKKARRLHLKTTRNRNPDLELDWTPFRAAEKKYKARFPPPDLSNVLDFACLDPLRKDEIQHGVWKGTPDAAGVKQLDSNGGLKAFAIASIPGNRGSHPLC